MEVLKLKRARLRQELQQAYGAWMQMSESWASPTATHTPVDVSGCPDSAKTKWFAYLAAKKQLILAYAEQPVAAR